MALMLRPHVGEAAGDAFVMFWLVVVMCVTLSEGVQCLTCKDNISPAHDTDACPLTTTVATNVAALTAVAGTVISVSKLLPIKVIRLFPRAIHVRCTVRSCIYVVCCLSDCSEWNDFYLIVQRSC